MPARIVFMGTPDFAVESLRLLQQSGEDIAAVVTAPDKPSGRGRKLKSPPVKTFAESTGIKVLQPEKLRDTGFIESLKSLNADIFVVVAFRMLPKLVWEIPRLGTFNLHASLLPQYRGAAPINWAIINGENETGVTTFLIDEEIDTGKIILREKVSIGDKMNAGELHDLLMTAGAELVKRTVEELSAGNCRFTDQSELSENIPELKPAPKINKEDCRIDWTLSSEKVYNLIRGLSPYPGAWTLFETSGKNNFLVKILKTDFCKKESTGLPGTIETTDDNQLFIMCRDGLLKISQFQPEGKKPMAPSEFLRGFRDKLVKAN